MTLILTIATLVVLTFLGWSCLRARLDLEEELCECAAAPVAAAVGFGPSRVELVPTPPVLIAIDGGLPRAPGVPPGRRAACSSMATEGRRSHLQVVEGR